MPPQFARYPMVMRHPAERAAVISDDYGDGERKAHNARAGQPLRFPPVTVLDEENETYHAAQGYVSTKGDPVAYAKATIAPEPPGYVHNEYPRIVNGVLETDPDAPPPPDDFFPYWHRQEGYEPTLVQDEDELRALLESRGVSSDRAVSDAEADCMASIMAAAGDAIPVPRYHETRPIEVVVAEANQAVRRGRPRKAKAEAVPE